MSAGRMRRVDEAMREVLSAAVAKDIKDPRVGFVTVTGVHTSADLKLATVYVSVLGDDAVRRRSMEGLQSAHGFLQKRVASELRLKQTPTLTFDYDDSLDRSMRINALLEEERAEHEAYLARQAVLEEAAAAEAGEPGPERSDEGSAEPDPEPSGEAGARPDEGDSDEDGASAASEAPR